MGPVREQRERVDRAVTEEARRVGLGEGASATSGPPQPVDGPHELFVLTVSRASLVSRVRVTEGDADLVEVGHMERRGKRPERQADEQHDRHHRDERCDQRAVAAPRRLRVPPRAPGPQRLRLVHQLRETQRSEEVDAEEPERQEPVALEAVDRLYGIRGRHEDGQHREPDTSAQAAHDAEAHRGERQHEDRKEVPHLRGHELAGPACAALAAGVEERKDVLELM